MTAGKRRRLARLFVALAMVFGGLGVATSVSHAGSAQAVEYNTLINIEWD